MTRKHYVKIAALIAGEAASATPEQRETLRRVMLSMADICRADNDRFDRQRFYTACGIDPYTRVPTREATVILIDGKAI